MFHQLGNRISLVPPPIPFFSTFSSLPQPAIRNVAKTSFPSSTSTLASHNQNRCNVGQRTQINYYPFHKLLKSFENYLKQTGRKNSHLLLTSKSHTIRFFVYPLPRSSGSRKHLHPPPPANWVCIMLLWLWLLVVSAAVFVAATPPGWLPIHPE